MTFEAAFKKIKEKFENVDAKKLSDMAIQITISDEDCGGTFYAEVRDGKLNVEPYDYKDNDAIVDITKKALYLILDGKLSFEAAVEKGEATLMGNIEKVATIKDAISAPVKKPATKKAPAKKEVAKKEVAKKEVAKKETPKTETAKKVSAKKTITKK